MECTESLNTPNFYLIMDPLKAELRTKNKGEEKENEARQDVNSGM